MTLTTPDRSLLRQHELAQKPLDGLVVLSPDFSFLLHQIDHSRRVSFENIPGLEQYSELNLHTLTVSGNQLLATVALDSSNLKRKTLPVRIAQQLGVTCGFFFGSATPLVKGGSGFVVIRDHINLLGNNPLIGPNQSEFGTRFPDMTDIYSSEIRASLGQMLQEGNRGEGILVAHADPDTLTVSEKEALQQVGDCYFSVHLVPEAIVARHGNMRFGSIIFPMDGADEEDLSDSSIPVTFQRSVEQIF